MSYRIILLTDGVCSPFSSLKIKNNNNVGYVGYCYTFGQWIPH
jgi:hypothetical protein